VELQKQGQLEGAVQEYNEALRLVGFEYGEEVIYSPYWESVPKAGTRIVVRFGDVQYSGNRNAYSLAKDLMTEAARLSGREFDERVLNLVEDTLIYNPLCAKVIGPVGGGCYGHHSTGGNRSWLFPCKLAWTGGGTPCIPGGPGCCFSR
jgi:hypothetical protein